MKIGEGTGPVEPTMHTYQKQLDVNATKFLDNLQQYNLSKNKEEQEYLRGLMDQQMGLIQTAISELNKKGLHKGASVVAKDYLDYTDEKTDENYTCLYNDLETLRDRNKS